MKQKLPFHLSGWWRIEKAGAPSKSSLKEGARATSGLTMPSTLLLLGLLMLLGFTPSEVEADECHLTPVFHVLQHPGCNPKPIPSFACTGKCTSYVQVPFFYSLSISLSFMRPIAEWKTCLCLRSPDQGCGRQRGPACAARRAGNERPWCSSTAPRLGQENQNLDR